MPEGLTVLIPCKNERRNIRPCIESARQVADEVLVADSLSTDDTLAIVRDVGDCRVIEREFINYSNFKNWAIPQAANAWVLIVDADERITPELAAEIRQLLADPPEQFDGYWISRRNYFMGHEVRHSGWDRDRVLRLIRRDVCRYKPVRVHEEIDLSPERTGALAHKFDHYPFWSYGQYLEKFARYTKFAAQDRFERGRRPSFTKMLLGGPLIFFKYYFIKRGFLDGKLGLQLSLLAAFSTFFKEAQLWELQHAQPRPDPERLHDYEQALLAAASGAAAGDEPPLNRAHAA